MGNLWTSGKREMPNLNNELCGAKSYKSEVAKISELRIQKLDYYFKAFWFFI